MLRKILLVMNLIFILSMGVVCAAERTYEVPDGGCTVSLPEQYAVTVVERPTDPNDEPQVRHLDRSAFPQLLLHTVQVN